MAVEPSPAGEGILKRIANNPLTRVFVAIAGAMAVVAGVVNNYKTIHDSILPPPAATAVKVTEPAPPAQNKTTYVIVVTTPESKVAADSTMISESGVSAALDSKPAVRRLASAAQSNSRSNGSASMQPQTESTERVDVPALPQRVMIDVFSPTDDGQIASRFKSALDQRLGTLSPLIPGTRIRIEFDEDGAKRGGGRIFGSWRFHLIEPPPATAQCDHQELARWYGRGGLADIEGAKSDVAEDGITRLLGWIDRRIHTAESVCD